MGIRHFTQEEQHIIRAFLVLQQRLPTQQELQTATAEDSLVAGLQALGVTEWGSVLQTYQQLGLPLPDELGMQYWQATAAVNRYQAVLDFQYVAQAEIEWDYWDILRFVHDELESAAKDSLPADATGMQAFTADEQHVIRAFLMLNGILPSQQQLDTSTQADSLAKGLELAGLDVASDSQSDAAFALSLYASMEGPFSALKYLPYWYDQAQGEHSLQALLDFQLNYKNHIDWVYREPLSELTTPLQPGDAPTYETGLDAFSLDEQHIIRSFLLMEQRLPSQEELDTAMQSSYAGRGLERAGLDLPTSSDVLNSEFATRLYIAVGDDSIDSQGLQYWAAAAQEDRAEAVVDFQFAAKSDIERLYASELLTVHEQLQSKYDEFDYYSSDPVCLARAITLDKMADESELQWPSFFDRSNDDDLLAALADSSIAPVQHSTHSLNDVHVEPAKLVALPDPTDSSALTLDWA
ncbi:hypothetical protein CHH28_01915 [Bacterioplanes sanyensis]|uniref:Uncharacterized protein n=1 Tax=Bacterioplanes sanyensis TaxID=1249553 RepID=A0A222FGY3_9GAMM|nr:hypothetical protein [Bacterioplanes sanyensis]ASP37503.1 hypothetical protein CHH28_01915 [Bacterioplanes sanyensis]